eukprot:XP_011677995.1 PREDICTED: uncharacterized protein LOC105444889 [Strongylocentrotus purpuratus]
MTDHEGWTALRSAAIKGHLEVTEYLINQGAEVNMGDNEGAEVNMGDRNGYTPMHIAALKDDLDIVKVLLENNGLLDHRDDEGLTAIQIATQNGRTQFVESLVSHGASLNIQSHDGKTCLHEAIILSDHMSRTEQTRTQQISEEFYGQGLFRKKAALVLYILEHGGKMDIRDVEGKLPIHYATNEVIRQMIFSRLPSIEMITRYRAEYAKPLVTVTAHVGTGGKQIELADLGISMIIPPGAIQGSGSCEITLTSIQDPQDFPSIDSQGDESLACLGIRCEPPNMIFHQPVKIKIPHSAVIVNPDQVKPDIVCRSWDLVKDLPRTSRHGSSSSPDKLPYCRVYKRHFELYVGHFAEWWVLIPLEQQVIRHQLMCTPYIPETMERGKEFEVHLHVHADVPGMDSEVLHEEKCQSYRKAHRSVPFSVISDSGEVTVERDCEGKIAETKKIAEKLSIDDFYDLGVALGFQIQELDAIEYKRLKDRHEAICEMLRTWKERQLPHQNIKDVLLSLLKSAETAAEETKMTGFTVTQLDLSADA